MRTVSTLLRLAAALALAGAPPARAPRRISDDHQLALSEARRLGVPIIVDVWAPW